MPKLGVNIDHVATIREARHTFEPDPAAAAAICEEAGCHSIVVHLRQDRRHINERDVAVLRKSVKTNLNLEMSCEKEIVALACGIRPDYATLVPEKKEELTTEGGLDVVSGGLKIKRVIEKLKNNGIEVSLFIDPVKKQIEASKKLMADFVEIHTGLYANAVTDRGRKKELNRIAESVRYALDIGLKANAGHGLTYQNVKAVAAISGIEELNIGHSIISRAVLVGLDNAVREMLALIQIPSPLDIVDVKGRG